MKLVKSLDIDGDGTISRKDFTKLVMLAGKSKVSTEQFYASDVYKNQSESNLLPDQVIAHLNKIISVNNMLGKPTPFVKSIFKKIGDWQRDNDGF